MLVGSMFVRRLRIIGQPPGRLRDDEAVHIYPQREIRYCRRFGRVVARKAITRIEIEPFHDSTWISEITLDPSEQAVDSGLLAEAHDGTAARLPDDFTTTDDCEGWY